MGCGHTRTPVSPTHLSPLLEATSGEPPGRASTRWQQSKENPDSNFTVSNGVREKGYT